MLANCSAVRELDANGTNFGYNPRTRTRRAGEFGHNDFYPVAVAAAQTRRLGRPPDARGDAVPRRNPRPAGRSLRAQEPQDRSRGARRDCLGGGLRRRAGSDRRSNRIGHRPGRRPLHSVPRDPPWPSTFRFQRRVGGDQRRSRRAEHAAGDARLRRPGRHLPQPASDLLPVRAAAEPDDAARSILRSRPPATTSP